MRAERDREAGRLGEGKIPSAQTGMSIAAGLGLKKDALPMDECDGCGVWGRGGRGARGGGASSERGNLLELELLGKEGSGSSPLSSSVGSIPPARINKHSSSRPHPSNHAQKEKSH